MYVLLQCIRLRDPAAVHEIVEALEGVVASLPMVRACLIQPAILTGPEDPQILARMCFDSEADYDAMLSDTVWHSAVVKRLQRANGTVVASVFYRRTLFAAPFPLIRGGIWRALMMTMNDGVDQPTRRRFENEMAMMPSYVSTIRNWAFNPVIASQGSQRWSYIFEQDFDDVDGLLGEYRLHPIHYGLIDRWFDAEHPSHILDSKLLRVVCNSPRGAIDPVGQ